ncbi:keratin-associated protein 21-1-like [Loxodonta africana]|uniref:keratin-associated protein 21-1-like n=1 Tax=Loxodonta africana TaxID=9785 RepID=UPI000C81294D|nr:keratin-associated protein 21-1-like [Loxodonta africana]
MCYNYYGGCGYGSLYGCGYGSLYGCGYGSRYGYGCCGYRPLCYRRWYSFCC